MITLGIECTAHTLGAGILKDDAIIADSRHSFVPPKGRGMNPVDVMNHHIQYKEKILSDVLEKASMKIDDIDVISYSAGPGLPPCLKQGFLMAKQLSEEHGKPLVAVNHPVAHIEIGRMLCNMNDPLMLYVSGGNTQIIGFAERKYRIFGETIDIPVGNCLDVFARECGLGNPGGPEVEKASVGGKYVELPYSVKGMDMSFTGLLTAAVKKFNEGVNINDLSFSLQETAYSMLTEVTERAMAHTGKNQLIAVGGVAASSRLREMLGTMCNERNAQFSEIPRQFAGDNGSMIAVAGRLAYLSGCIPVMEDFNPAWRVDEVEIGWRE